MNIEQRSYSEEAGWQLLPSPKLKYPASLVFAFGARTLVQKKQLFTEIRSFYPEARIILGSTAGEILASTVSDNSISLTALSFEDTTVKCVEESISSPAESTQVAAKLVLKLPQEGLRHVMVFSDGLKTNGTALVGALVSALPPAVAVTGGLVGDGADFKETAVGLDGPAVPGRVVLIGFYGSRIAIGYGSLGGWDSFGPERAITRSKDNVLYEINGRPALELYKEYLGDAAKDLPSSGLLFPLSLRLSTEHGDEEVVRTVLTVNEQDQSMTFAGDMPEGTPVKLMKANFDRLVDGASGAATMSIERLGEQPADFALLISCVGRKLVLGPRIEEEIDAVREVLGGSTPVAGFYSYGEISPVAPTEKQCRLHNQTMTITTFRETHE